MGMPVKIIDGCGWGNGVVNSGGKCNGTTVSCGGKCGRNATNSSCLRLLRLHVVVEPLAFQRWLRRRQLLPIRLLRMLMLLVMLHLLLDRTCGAVHLLHFLPLPLPALLHFLHVPLPLLLRRRTVRHALLSRSLLTLLLRVLMMLRLRCRLSMLLLPGRG